MASNKAEIVKRYLADHPDTPSRTITKYLRTRYPEMWETENACYMSVRKYRGEAGVFQRDCTSETFPKIPKGEKKKKPLIRINTPGKYLIIGDLHVPYHDEKALEQALKYGYDSGCTHVIVNGDALDAYQQSQWVKDPAKRSVDKEIGVLKSIYAEISRMFAGDKWYKIGNHEERIETYLFMNAPKMIGMSKWDLCKALNDELEIPSWSMVDSKQLYKLGKLNGYHGHELPRGLTSPVSVGRGLWNRTRQTGFCNHHHATSTHIESSGSKDKTWVCFSVGCLCDLQPNYAPVNGWNHGFAVIEIEAGGNFRESNHRIVNGEVW
jgi:hypothetical protein